MRKIFTLSLTLLALLAFAVLPAMAGDDQPTTNTTDKPACTGHSTTGTQTAEKGGCPYMKGANATQASATGKVCTGKDGKPMSAEECAKLCPAGGKCEMVNMSVKGMTCGGCEGTVTAALEKVPGVLKVVSVSYKDGTALVCVDPTKCEKKTLTTAVVDKGYDAQIVPAVATTTTAAAKTDSKSCAKVCSPENKAACAGKKGDDEKAKTDNSN